MNVPKRFGISYIDLTPVTYGPGDFLFWEAL